MSTLVSVIGLGYVGLPLAIAAAKSGYQVTGIDLDEVKVREVNDGKSQIEDIDNGELSNLIQAGKITAESNYTSVEKANVIIICVKDHL
jgi:UDP-N-acetyl-D-glucosamine dehydrogenase